jgi:hypothetical protein
VAEVAMPPGGARRHVRPLVASQIVGKSLRLWFSSLPQLVVITSIAWLPFFALRWILYEQTGWKATLENSLQALQLVAVTSIGQAFAVRFVFQRLRGEPADLARSIARGGRRIATVLGIALLLALPQIAYMGVATRFQVDAQPSHDPKAVLEGAAYLMLAGVAFFLFEMIVVLVYPVAAPAAVVEGEGVFASLRRSASLTKGRRLTIFGIIFIFGLLWLVPVAVLMFVIFSMRGTAQFFTRAGMELFFASLHCVTPVVLYHELRDTKEGFGLEDLAAVFD